MNPTAEFPGFWVHFIETVYGAWLHGDRRGFRTRHHREHVEGDYHSPPPMNAYENRRRRSMESLKQSPVELRGQWRPVVGMALRQRLEDKNAFPLCMAISFQHAHILAKLPIDADPRDLVGRAKKHAAFEAKAVGWQGKLWARGGKAIIIPDRQYQKNVYHYILGHEAEGAWIWRGNR